MNVSTWGMRGLYVIIGDQTVLSNEIVKTSIFEPMLPYLYLPSSDITNFYSVMIR
jgi:hypothetical protein